MADTGTKVGKCISGMRYPEFYGNSLEIIHKFYTEQMDISDKTQSCPVLFIDFSGQLYYSGITQTIKTTGEV